MRKHASVVAEVQDMLACDASCFCNMQSSYDSQAARKLLASKEILLWMTPSEAPKALQASGCSELLDLTRTSSWISAQH